MEQGEGSADLTGLAGQKKRIPAFVRKLRSMLDNKDVIQIKWTPDGAAFRVFDSVTFSRDVLPNYFKHNNWQSFIRQLNIYGFIKLTDAMHTAAVSHSNSTPQSDWSFRHPLFLRKYPRRMEEIKRRAPK
ncbi:winged helix DNA-binding domain-containing protein, partial [Tilletiaria anomala UBC 951]